jgi:ABC-type phosphate transport system permease subunit
MDERLTLWVAAIYDMVLRRMVFRHRVFRHRVLRQNKQVSGQNNPLFGVVHNCLNALSHTSSSIAELFASRVVILLMDASSEIMGKVILAALFPVIQTAEERLQSIFRKVEPRAKSTGTTSFGSILSIIFLDALPLIAIGVKRVVLEIGETVFLLLTTLFNQYDVRNIEEICCNPICAELQLCNFFIRTSKI